MNSTLNSKIYSGTQFYKLTRAAFNGKQSVVISFLNPFSYYEVSKEQVLIEEVDYYFSDGSMLCLLHSFFFTKISRCSFDYSSIARGFLENCSSSQKRVAIIGATTAENQKAVDNLKQEFCELNVVYSRNGYIRQQEKPNLVKELDAKQIECVILGMGTPHQEQLAIYLKQNLAHQALIITCGGFLTQTSIKPDYYHPWIKKLGLRWLQRMWMHKHVRQRVFKSYPKFLFNYIIKSIGLKIGK